MASDKKYHSDGPSAADKALDRFTELMIEKIQSFEGNWKNHGSCLGLPCLPRTSPAGITTEATP